MDANKIYQQDSLEYLKEQKEFEFDLIFGDPPYALGSELCIKDGKIEYKKAVDFMNKWEMPSGQFWQNWFNESFRTLKHGGYCILFGMDRQSVMFKYYALNAGFTINQSLYWYFISNFPKASDLSKNIDKHLGAERKVVGKIKRGDVQVAKQKGVGYLADNANRNNTKQFGYGEEIISNPSTPLAQKYSGYKYSISPLKQTCEEIMIFQKPYKTKSCLHDVLAMENGDETITCGALDIDGNKVGVVGFTKKDSYKHLKENENYHSSNRMNFNRALNVGTIEKTDSGRYPAQTFITSETAEILDRQSGENLKGRGKYIRKTGDKQFFNSMKNGKVDEPDGLTDFGGCSKILHQCNYELLDYDIFNYCPKVSKSERNAGLEPRYNLFEDYEGEEEKNGGSRNASGRVIGGKRSLEGDAYFDIKMKNNHPTLKPIKLIERILGLFKTPNEQKIYFPFAGSGSEIIGGIKAGFTNWVATEINKDYARIAEKRIGHWTESNPMLNFQQVVQNGQEKSKCITIISRTFNS